MKALALLLLSLVFLSKISLSWVGIVPYQIPNLIFQHGMHPYLNMIGNILLGLPLIFMWLRSPQKNRQHPFYRLFVFLLAGVLTVQTLVQILYVHPEQSLFLQVSGLLLALYLILLFGIILPSVLNGDEALNWLWKWSVGLTLLSLVLWMIMPDQVYKGGRFIGVFKHIPYMVTSATLAFVFTLPKLLYGSRTRFRVFCYVLILIAAFVAIILTGTRSSAFAAALAVLVTLVIMPTPSTNLRFVKFITVTIGTTVLLFFGPHLFEVAHDIARGEQALMGRAAQDGISTRLEEVERGMKIFEAHPFAGMGILFRFMSSGDGVDVDDYNSFKDPHNLFVSAGVVGGWPLLAMSVLGFFMLVWGAVMGLFERSYAYRWMAVYLLVHVPILLIYHVHLSLGGMADRVYWLIFGLVAVQASREVFDKKLTKH